MRFVASSGGSASGFDRASNAIVKLEAEEPSTIPPKIQIGCAFSNTSMFVDPMTARIASSANSTASR